MLNLIAFDPESDKELIQNSYDCISNKDRMEIVIAQPEKNTILLKIKFALIVPEFAVLSIQNLFKFNLPNGHFYIAHCLFDFGFSNRRFPGEHKYYFQTIGIADTCINLGKTMMRPETRTDKIVGRIFGNDIDLTDTKLFNDKYYLVSSAPSIIQKHFDKSFVNTISKYDDLIMSAHDKEMCITFDTEVEANHTAIIEEIFSNCRFLISNI